MSILINGMEMPENCGECPLYGHLSIHENIFRFCRLTRMETRPMGRRNDCPLIEVPPHGDLIDRYAAIRSAFKGEQNIYCWDEIEEAIDSVPAIIESEE